MLPVLSLLHMKNKMKIQILQKTMQSWDNSVVLIIMIKWVVDIVMLKLSIINMIIIIVFTIAIVIVIMIVRVPKRMISIVIISYIIG